MFAKVHGRVASFMAVMLMSNSTDVQASRTLSYSRVFAPEPFKWKKDDGYLCMLKWQKKLNDFTGQGCLVNLDEAVKMQKGMVVDHLYCQAKTKPYRMKVCLTKGKGKEIRIAYKERAAVPKACFREAILPVQGKEIAVLESAMTSSACHKLYGTDHKLQNVLQKVKPRPKPRAKPKPVVAAAPASSASSAAASSAAAPKKPAEPAAAAAAPQDPPQLALEEDPQEEAAPEGITAEDAAFLDRLREEEGDDSDPILQVPSSVRGAGGRGHGGLPADDDEPMSPKPAEITEIDVGDIATIRQLWIARDRQAYAKQRK
eukprot:TRINITY_DN18965_c0_g1_i1.p1 TRINITY_DN18965_c0_g1~~TRINITY_DN18965_c0_g1_i1.p1  ORF type:complete len:316 (-),score=77.53 TRINITY_DN18965_c0_g1_i1:345-1292(-)